MVECSYIKCFACVHVSTFFSELCYCSVLFGKGKYSVQWSFMCIIIIKQLYKNCCPFPNAAVLRSYPSLLIYLGIIYYCIKLYYITNSNLLCDILKRIYIL